MGWFDWADANRGSSPNGAPSPDVPHTLALYETRSCPYCHRVRVAVNRLGLDVPSRDLNVDSDHRRALRAATGRTTVPCLNIDGYWMFESADIIAWLEAFAAGGARA